MKQFLFYASRLLFAVVCWIAIVFAVAAIMSATAHARPFGVSECVGLAHAARQMAEFRDQKATPSEIRAAVDEQAQKSLSDPQSYVRTTEDVQMMLGLVDRVYALKQPPLEVERTVFMSCAQLSGRAPTRDL